MITNGPMTPEAKLYCESCYVILTENEPKPKKQDKDFNVVCSRCGVKSWTVNPSDEYKCGFCINHPGPELMSASRAFDVYKKAIYAGLTSTDEAPRIIPKALEYLKRTLGLPQSAAVMRLVKPLSELSKVDYRKLLESFAEKQISEDALNTIIRVHRESTLAGVEARHSDKTIVEYGYEPTNYMTYCRDLDGAFCQAADDPTEKLPF
jgi:hypothetical protein